MAATETLSLRGRGRRVAALVRAETTPEALVLAAALPVLFLHVDYEPGVHFGLGSTSVAVELSDLGVLLVTLAALRAGLRRGFAPLVPARLLWAVAAALLVWVLIRSQSLTHFVTAAKFAEYGFLAVSAPLLLRRRADWELVAAAVSVWSAVATFVAVLQFFGVSVADAWPAGRRQPSFLGHIDFAALSGLAIAIGLAGLVLARRRLAWAPLASGTIGLVLAGGSAGLAGALAGCVAMLVVASRRGRLDGRGVLLVGAVAAIVTAGVLTLRAGDFDQFLRFLGVEKQQATTRQNVQTYAHHTLLAYIGYRIWLRHPVAGVGWQRSSQATSYRPALPAAHRKFPDEPEIAFPGPGREYGVQNGYVQAAADLGLVGLVLWISMLGMGLVTALRADVPPGAVGAFGLLVAIGLWGAQGLVAGIPLDALTWLALGLAATAAASADSRA